MISFEEALAITEKYKPAGSVERIPFTESLGRCLAEDIISDMDMPPFNKSAVDGYACRRDDLGNDMVIKGVAAAGRPASVKVGRGECIKIMTGAAVPEGADWVFMVEYAEESNGKVSFTGKAFNDNIAKRGEDIRKGDVALKAGRELAPQDIAVLATVGAVEVTVSKKPVIGVISTGDELVEPYEKPSVSQIRNSNGYQLVAQAIRAGAEAIYYGIAPDNEDETYRMVITGMDECDILLLTGGVSAGDFDMVPLVMERAGIKILFDRVAVQPGKPTTFGIHDDAIVFGLPGNPVSSFVQFELFVKPMIKRTLKVNKIVRNKRHLIAVDYRRKRTGRMTWVPVMADSDDYVIPVEYHGSAHINALPDAYGLMQVPVGVAEIKKGEAVNVRQI